MAAGRDYIGGWDTGVQVGRIAGGVIDRGGEQKSNQKGGRG